jgi:hypothetical protein
MRLPPQIETPRLIIRPLVAGDLETFVSFMTDEETTTAFMFSDEQKTEKEAQVFFDRIITSYSSNAPYFVYAIAPSIHQSRESTQHRDRKATRHGVFGRGRASNPW